MKLQVLKNNYHHQQLMKHLAQGIKGTTPNIEQYLMSDLILKVLSTRQLQILIVVIMKGIYFYYQMLIFK